jgi:hypothetical protein
MAEEDFCGDYGMTLKWLMDDIPGQDIRMILVTLQDHSVRIEVLEEIIKDLQEIGKEGKSEGKDSKTEKKMCNGSTRRVGK